MIKNIVLVHGAWADGSSWSKVIPKLHDAGLNPVSAQHPLSSLDADVAAVDRIVNAQNGPVLLVGHSYGGAIITVAGSNPKVRGMVYVAAFAPDAAETLAGMAQPYGATPAFAELRQIADGYLLLTAKGVQECFAQDLAADEQAMLLATQGATHGAILGTPIPSAAWHEKPSWFIVATNDRTISPEQERVSAERMKAKILSLSTSHVAMLAKPTEVANFIIEAAASID